MSSFVFVFLFTLLHTHMKPFHLTLRKEKSSPSTTSKILWICWYEW